MNDNRTYERLIKKKNRGQDPSVKDITYNILRCVCRGMYSFDNPYRQSKSPSLCTWSYSGMVTYKIHVEAYGDRIRILGF